MFGKHLLVAGATAIAALTFASGASAGQCLGLDCPGTTQAFSAAQGPVTAVAKPQDLEKQRTSGFFDFGSNGPTRQRAIAYVVAPGEWGLAPDEIKQLPAADTVPASERAKNTIVFYGPRTLVSVPPVVMGSAAKKRDKKKSVKARAAAFSDCPSNYFCLFDSTNGNGARGQWASVGVWQNLSAFGWQGRARSMRNRRNAWSLLERVSGGRYCAVPNSQDGSLANNGYDQNTTRIYLSTATTKHAAWGCTN